MIDDTLYDAFGQRQVSTMFTQLNQYHVVLEVDPEFQTQSRKRLRIFTCTSTSGGAGAAEHVRPVRSRKPVPLIVNHQGQFPAVTISFNLAPGYRWVMR